MSDLSFSVASRSICDKLADKNIVKKRPPVERRRHLADNLQSVKQSDKKINVSDGICKINNSHELDKANVHHKHHHKSIQVQRHQSNKGKIEHAKLENKTNKEFINEIKNNNGVINTRGNRILPLYAGCEVQMSVNGQNVIVKPSFDSIGQVEFCIAKRGKEDVIARTLTKKEIITILSEAKNKYNNTLYTVDVNGITFPSSPKGENKFIPWNHILATTPEKSTNANKYEGTMAKGGELILFIDESQGGRGNLAEVKQETIIPLNDIIGRRTLNTDRDFPMYIDDGKGKYNKFSASDTVSPSLNDIDNRLNKRKESADHAARNLQKAEKMAVKAEDAAKKSDATDKEKAYAIKARKDADKAQSINDAAQAALRSVREGMITIYFEMERQYGTAAVRMLQDYIIRVLADRDLKTLHIDRKGNMNDASRMILLQAASVWTENEGRFIEYVAREHHIPFLHSDLMFAQIHSADKIRGSLGNIVPRSLNDLVKEERGILEYLYGRHDLQALSASERVEMMVIIQCVKDGVSLRRFSPMMLRKYLPIIEEIAKDRKNILSMDHQSNKIVTTNDPLRHKVGEELSSLLRIIRENKADVAKCEDMITNYLFKVGPGNENEIINDYADLLSHNPLILEVEKTHLYTKDLEQVKQEINGLLSNKIKLEAAGKSSMRKEIKDIRHKLKELSRIRAALEIAVNHINSGSENTIRFIGINENVSNTSTTQSYIDRLSGYEGKKERDALVKAYRKNITEMISGSSAQDKMYYFGFYIQEFSSLSKGYQDRIKSGTASDNDKFLAKLYSHEAKKMTSRFSYYLSHLEKVGINKLENNLRPVTQNALHMIIPKRPEEIKEKFVALNGHDKHSRRQQSVLKIAQELAIQVKIMVNWLKEDNMPNALLMAQSLAEQLNTVVNNLETGEQRPQDVGAEPERVIAQARELLAQINKSGNKSQLLNYAQTLVTQFNELKEQLMRANTAPDGAFLRTSAIANHDESGPSYARLDTKDVTLLRASYKTRNDSKAYEKHWEKIKKIYIDAGANEGLYDIAVNDTGLSLAYKKEGKDVIIQYARNGDVQPAIDMSTWRVVPSEKNKDDQYKSNHNLFVEKMIDHATRAIITPDIKDEVTMQALKLYVKGAFGQDINIVDAKNFNVNPKAINIIRHSDGSAQLVTIKNGVNEIHRKETDIFNVVSHELDVKVGKKRDIAQDSVSSEFIKNKAEGMLFSPDLQIIVNQVDVRRPNDENSSEYKEYLNKKQSLGALKEKIINIGHFNKFILRLPEGTAFRMTKDGFLQTAGINGGNAILSQVYSHSEGRIENAEYIPQVMTSDSISTGVAQDADLLNLMLDLDDIPNPNVPKKQVAHDLDAILGELSATLPSTESSANKLQAAYKISRNTKPDIALTSSDRGVNASSITDVAQEAATQKNERVVVSDRDTVNIESQNRTLTSADTVNQPQQVKDVVDITSEISDLKTKILDAIDFKKFHSQIDGEIAVLALYSYLASKGSRLHVWRADGLGNGLINRVDFNEGVVNRGLDIGTKLETNKDIHIILKNGHYDVFSPSSMKSVQVHGDGNCLFHSAAAMLNRIAMNNDAAMKGDYLNAMTKVHLEDNFDRFVTAFFHAYDEVEISRMQDGDLKTHSQKLFSLVKEYKKSITKTKETVAVQLADDLPQSKTSERGLSRKELNRLYSNRAVLVQ
ncbi:hypothetical protein VC897_04480 [Citrobacter youngae]|uniref:hypothetical protein n=1 Tax=Citrobacter youngae TaxID=133448 RepID=UPI002B23948B|nr:hypothetical protein [Citrobacter youngae]MEB0863791.1 hypothetical protein [Citrobacter youngae]